MGVIIADNTCLCSDEQASTCQKQDDVSCEQVEPIMADDGSGGDIIIPRYGLHGIYLCLTRLVSMR